MQRAALISVNPPYSRHLLSQYKPCEFRRVILSALRNPGCDEIDIFIYETKNKGGCGAVIGKVKCKECLDVWYGKSATIKADPKKRDLLMSLLYRHWDEWRNRNGEDNTPAFGEYLKEIGFCEDDAEPNFNHAVFVQDCCSFETPKPLSDFRLIPCGKWRITKTLTRPPQNMCYVADAASN